MIAALPHHSWLRVERRGAPLVLSIPHAGRQIGEDCWRALSNDVALVRNDTDFHVDELYDFVHELDITVVMTDLCRTVIDVNRDPSGASLYPGQTTTGLCPLTTFSGIPLYKPGREPGPDEIARRRQAYFEPYHRALAGEIERLKSLHGRVVLWDAHAIHSRVPALFDGVLRDLNFGTNDGRSCAPALIAGLEALVPERKFTRVTNGRFKGGYITRHYGDPANGVHAVQLELALRTFVTESKDGRYPDGPPDLHPHRASLLRPVLRRLLQACIDFARTPT